MDPIFQKEMGGQTLLRITPGWLRAALRGGRVWVGGAGVTSVRRFWKIPQWDGPNVSFHLLGPEGRARAARGGSGWVSVPAPSPKGSWGTEQAPRDGHTASPLPLKETGEGKRKKRWWEGE